MSEAEIPNAPPEALFILDLGENGGVVAPTTLTELASWIDSEVQAWSWLTSFSAGNHKNAIDSNLQPLRNAQNVARQAVQYAPADSDIQSPHLAELQAAIRETFIARQFPHSTSPLGRRVDELQKRDPLEAAGYLYTKMLNAGAYQFDARDLPSWHGFLTGLQEQMGLEGVPGQAFEAALKSFSGVQAEAERPLAEKTEAYSALHRDYRKLADQVAVMKSGQETQFQRFLDVNQEGHDGAMAAHKATMANLEQVFREKMKLRPGRIQRRGRLRHVAYGSPRR